MNTLLELRNKMSELVEAQETLIKEADAREGEKRGGEVPCSREDLEALPGVGRKTANVVLSVGRGIPAFAVDTHVTRIAYRLGFVPEGSSARQVEEALTAHIDMSQWVVSHHRMIFFGRYHCKARTPQCSSCPFAHTVCRVSQQFLSS